MAVLSQQTSLVHPFQNMGSKIGNLVLRILLHKLFEGREELSGFSCL